ncbi:WecB/TagA/CpsF family glycosyltransferase [Salinicoccus halodurans]|nr:WecB/TagA/CpsF family glycosyltransferase [Salinicoccus halodurans]AKG73444.1 acetylglucosaminyldiphospho-UDP acetyl-beta-D-mannosaminyltransferase [Salinicoccus halodurans]
MFTERKEVNAMGRTYKTVTVMDIDFFNTSMNAFLKHIVYPDLANGNKCFIVTANPEIVIETRDHPEFKKVVQSADYVLADGVGVVNAAMLLGQPLPERVSGIDVMYHMLDHAAKQGYSVFFLGASEDSNKKAVENAEKIFPGLKIAGRHDGYFDPADESIARMVVDSNPDIVLVALGMQRQEGWIADNIDKFDKGVFMGVGGSFDVLSGKAQRAPKIWIKLQLEWLYRLIKEPKRIKRVLRVFEFMLLHTPVVKHVIKMFGFNKTRPRGKS